MSKEILMYIKSDVLGSLGIHPGWNPAAGPRQLSLICRQASFRLTSENPDEYIRVTSFQMFMIPRGGLYTTARADVHPPQWHAGISGAVGGRAVDLSGFMAAARRERKRFVTIGTVIRPMRLMGFAWHEKVLSAVFLTSVEYCWPVSGSGAAWKLRDWSDLQANRELFDAISLMVVDGLFPAPNHFDVSK